MSGHAWDVVNWLSYGVAPAITLARRRIPRTTLLLIVGIAVVAMGVRAAGPSVFFVLMALYSVVAVSPRSRASYIAGAVVVAMVIATVAGGGNQVVESCIGVVASMLLAWAAGETLGLAGSTPFTRRSASPNVRRLRRRSRQIK